MHDRGGTSQRHLPAVAQVVRRRLNGIGHKATATAKIAKDAKTAAKRNFKLIFFFASCFASFASFAVAFDRIS
jgi:hypothetical protein